jgi:hypothetical protein
MVAMGSISAQWELVHTSCTSKEKCGKFDTIYTMSSVSALKKLYGQDSIFTELALMLAI